jgi:hypothetical protein
MCGYRNKLDSSAIQFCFSRILEGFHANIAAVEPVKEQFITMLEEMICYACAIIKSRRSFRLSAVR